LATRSARGGTTGRAAGWPARFGLAGGRRGAPPPTGCATGPGAEGEGRVGTRGVGMLGIVDGRGAPGDIADGAADGCPSEAGAFGASGSDGDIGCRGPEIICPGRGVGGAGFTGIDAPRLTGGDMCGAEGPVASGGRSGAVERAGASGASRTASGGACTCDAGGSCLATGCVRGASGSSMPGAARWLDGAAGGAAGGAAWCSSSCAERAGSDSSSDPARRRRSAKATSSSSELEWVFLSATPNTGRRSMMTLGLTSNSRASSLIRILLIRG